MQKVIHSDNVKTAIQTLGWTQKDLAARLGVTGQAVTNWMKGTDFPRPDKLLKLAAALRLPFEQLVLKEASPHAPVIAFRTKANVKTTEEHILKAKAMGEMLRPLIEFLEPMPGKPSYIANPSLAHANLQALALELRQDLGKGEQAALRYQDLIGEFAENRAVLVPVMWGEKRDHRNALHILLPQERITFVFLNLDVYLEDFKFWMAHELAHVYTPELAGTNAGEDFADALAGSLLFPQALAQQAYSKAQHAGSKGALAVLQRFAQEHSISLNTVFGQVRRYAQEFKLAPLVCDERAIHAVRMKSRGEHVSAAMYKPAAPTPAEYMASAKNVFRSQFFEAMRRMIKSKNTGAGYIQQVMDIPMQDAMALHAELAR